MRLRHDTAAAHAITDPKDFGRVAVLLGGASSERDVSLRSGAAVLAALLRRDVDAVAFDPAERPLAQLAEAGFDRAWIALHGAGGEDGTLQGALEYLGVPYTGSGVPGSAIGMDKVRTKQLAQAVGIATADYVVIRTPADLQVALDRLGLPLILKPATQGSSVGMTKVTRVDNLPAAFQAAAEIDECVLAEQWLPGQEYTVAILQGEALPIIRIDDTRYHVPSGLSAPAAAHLGELALATFEVVGAEGWGRVDFRSDVTGRPQLLEINTVPGMTDHSLVPMAAQAAGIDFDTLTWRVLETSCTRQQREVA